MVVLFGMLCSCSPQSADKLFIITDIEADVDDAVALCLALSDPSVQIVGVACTSSEVENSLQTARHLLSLLHSESVPVGSGYRFIDSILVHTHGQSNILLIAQATSLNEALRYNPSLITKISRIYFQGQAQIDEKGIMMPDPQAFNVREDMLACYSLFEFQGQIPFTLVGKYAAYPLALSREDFDGFASSGHPAGVLLRDMAVETNARFSQDHPELYHKIYPDTNILSQPYDAVALLSLLEPDSFSPVILDNHLLIGMIDGESNIIPSKYDILKGRLRTIFLSLPPEKLLTTNNNL